MKRYRHYSFDLWQTLIRSNIGFREARARWLTSNFNPGKLPYEEVLAITSETAKMCDQISEASQFSMHPAQMYGIVLYRLGFDVTKLHQRDLSSMLNVVESQFRAHPPFVYDDSVFLVLQALKHEGATISITCNTGFIPGHYLERFLIDVGVGQYIDFYLFSDQLGICKPSYSMFMKMCSMANHLHEVRGRGPLLPREILHVGDNHKTDIIGAETAGVDSFMIHGASGKTLKDLLL